MIEVRPSIAVLRISALGDAVLVLPLINQLILSRKYHEVHWVTTQSVVDLIGPISGCSYIVVSKVKSLKTLFLNWLKLKSHSFNTLIVAQASFSAHAISIFIKAQKKIGFDRRRGKDLHHLFIDESINYEDQHFVEAYMNLGELAGAPSIQPHWGNAFGHLCSKRAKSLRVNGKRLVALHPHASKLERRWSNEGYVRVVRFLLQKNCNVVILGGTNEFEKKLNEEIANSYDSGVNNLTGELSLAEWASMLREVDLLIAPDTGAVHLANALSTKVVGLYAVANPKLTGPLFGLENCVNRYPQSVSKFSSKVDKDYHHRVHDERAM
ncbi:MAG: glycosyltransferase family 9 protein, partial [Opitutales bacterium]|nr:glycosyltransferase family 9 protein [Opitutales bacterium]